MVLTVLYSSLTCDLKLWPAILHLCLSTSVQCCQFCQHPTNRKESTAIVTLVIINLILCKKNKQKKQKKKSGPGCSKLTTLLVNVSLKFQTLISEICQYFLSKKCEKLLQCKSFSHFFDKKYQCIWL